MKRGKLLAILIITCLLTQTNTVFAQITGSKVGVQEGDSFTYKRTSHISSDGETETDEEEIEIRIKSVFEYNKTIIYHIKIYENGQLVFEEQNYVDRLAFSLLFTYADREYWNEIQEDWMDENNWIDSEERDFNNFLGTRTFKRTISDQNLQGETEYKYNKNGVLVFRHNLHEMINGFSVEITFELKGLKRFLSSPAFTIGLILVGLFILGIIVRYGILLKRDIR